MALGTPARIDDLEAFVTRIRGGRPPTAELLRELRARYAAIGGRSPLLEITWAQARGVEARLNARRTGRPVRAYVGMKHAAPFITDAVSAMRADGIGRAVGLPLTPHPSALTTEDYAAIAQRAIAESGGGIALEVVPTWHLHPAFLACLATRVLAALAAAPEDERRRTAVIFTAHSLPLRVVERGDPYRDAVEATARAVAERAALRHWHLAWQSAGRTGEPWLGPDVSEVLPLLAGTGTRAVVLCPIGFVSDHLEILYDIDIHYRRLADDLGLRLVRTASLNDDPLFLDALADVVRRRFAERNAA